LVIVGDSLRIIRQAEPTVFVGHNNITLRAPIGNLALTGRLEHVHQCCVRGDVSPYSERMNDHEQALWRTILEEPGTIAPRLSLAARWGGARERFVRAQIEVSDLMRAGRTYARPSSEAKRLLAGNERAWAGDVADRVPTFRFLRGFVEWVVVDAAAFAGSWKQLFDSAPIRHIDVAGIGAAIDTFFACEGLERIIGLSFNLYGTPHNTSVLGDRGARALAACSHLRGLRYLDVRHNAIGEDALAELTRSPNLSALDVGLIDNNAIAELREDVTHDYDGTLTDIRPSKALYQFEQKHAACSWLHAYERRGRYVLREEL
jgi:hypothetical protein